MCDAATQRLPNERRCLPAPRFEFDIVVTHGRNLLQYVETRAERAFAALDITDAHLIPAELPGQFHLRQSLRHAHLAHLPSGAQGSARQAGLFLNSRILRLKASDKLVEGLAPPAARDLRLAD